MQVKKTPISIMISMAISRQKVTDPFYPLQPQHFSPSRNEVYEISRLGVLLKCSDKSNGSNPDYLTDCHNRCGRSGSLEIFELR